VTVATLGFIVTVASLFRAEITWLFAGS